MHLLCDFLLWDPFLHCFSSIFHLLFSPFLFLKSIFPTISSFLCPHPNCPCRSGREAASAKGEAAAGGGRESQGRAGKEADSVAGWGSHGQRGIGKIHLVSLIQNQPFKGYITYTPNKISCQIELTHIFTSPSSFASFCMSFTQCSHLLSLTIASFPTFNLPCSCCVHAHPSL